MRQNCKTHFIFNCMNLLLLFSLVLSAQTGAPSNVPIELRLRPGELINGVPDTFSFVLVNAGNHDVRIPNVSRCLSRHSGTVALRLELSPVSPTSTGQGGGCAQSVDPPRMILEDAKFWTTLKPGESFTVSYKRVELFVFEQVPGAYEFWGEYRPPKLTGEEIGLLQRAGIDFASETLRSAPLRFNRPN